METAFTVPTSYLYTNILFMGTLMWTITTTTPGSIDPIAMV
jgi:hypothetical protein